MNSSPSTSTPPTDPPQPITPLGWIGRGIGGLFLLVVLYVGVRLMYEQVLAPFYAPTPAITVGHDTTRIDGPLDHDGYVDYVAALDAELSAGVTPENNAVVLFFEAVGPKDISVMEVNEFFLQLGVRVLPLRGDYLREADEFPPLADRSPNSADAQRRFNEHGDAFQRPWTRAEFPDVAAWLDANAAPLEKIVAASRRPRWYLPRMRTKVKYGLAKGISYYDYSMRNAASALCVRAMRSISAGDFEAAWEDAEVIARLADLIGQGPFVEDWMYMQAINGFSSHIRRRVAIDGRVSPELLRTLHQRHRNRASLPSLASCLDKGDRYVLLEACQFEARNPDGHAATSWINWNEAHTVGNPWFDSCVAALKVANRQQQLLAVEAWEVRLIEFRDEQARWGTYARDWVRGESLRTLRGRAIGVETLASAIPPIGGILHKECESVITHDFIDLAFALAEFRAANGAYPKTLAELTPAYYRSLPIDPYATTPQSYQYAPTNKGYLLSSQSQADLSLRVPEEDEENTAPASPSPPP